MQSTYRFSGLFRVAAASLAFLACLAGRASAGPLDTATPAPEWTKTVGTMQVQKFGSGEPALILVPGLACGSWVFNDTIAREAPHHTIYAVTLAGFDGLPYDPAADTLDAADASIGTLIAQESIAKPILIGHSMGGFLALRFGTEHPELLREVVSIDGLPVLPNLSLFSTAQVDKYANGYASGVKASTPAQYAAGQKAFVRDMVTTAPLATQTAALTQRSDQNAVADYGRELFLGDLRPQMLKLNVPTMLMAPIPAHPLPSYYPAIVANDDQQQLTVDIVQTYGQLTAGAPLLTIVPIVNARHFIMLDQPDKFASALDTFIAAH